MEAARPLRMLNCSAIVSIGMLVLKMEICIEDEDRLDELLDDLVGLNQSNVLENDRRRSG